MLWQFDSVFTTALGRSRVSESPFAKFGQQSAGAIDPDALIVLR